MLDMGQLIARMTAPDPKQRPTAAGALREWQALQKRTSAVSRGWRLQPQDDSDDSESESLLVRVTYDVVQPVSTKYKWFGHQSYSRMRIVLSRLRIFEICLLSRSSSAAFLLASLKTCYHHRSSPCRLSNLRLFPLCSLYCPYF